NDETRGILVGELSKSHMYEAVKMLNGSLMKQLEWMAMRGCEDAWIKERIGAITDEKQRLEVISSRPARERVLKMSNEDRAWVAKTLGGTPDQMLYYFQNDVPIGLIKGAPGDNKPSDDWINALLHYRKDPMDVLWIATGSPGPWAPYVAKQLWNMLKDFHG